MNRYSDISSNRLATCHPDIRRMCMRVLKIFDHKVMCGWRGQVLQDRCYRLGMSTLQWPDSKHNWVNMYGEPESLAVDLCPHPYAPWNGDRILFFAGKVTATAEHMGIDLRWGGDWNRDNVLINQTFNDRFHYELVNW